MPVELSMFEAEYVDGVVHLQWLTQTEKDNLGFIIQRKIDDADWEFLVSFQTDENLRGQGTSAMPTLYSFLDDSVQANTTYHYRLADVQFDGAITFHDPIQISTGQMNAGLEVVPEQFRVYSAYPNPFNPVTRIVYDIASPSHVIISVYDMRGRIVQTLLSEYQHAGRYSIKWNATNDIGEHLNSGVFFIRIQAGQSFDTKKVILLR